MSAVPFPHRPRIAEHALIRKHVIEGRDVVVIHHAETGDLLRMGPRELSLIEAADGTRDLDALALAAASKGVYQRASEIRDVLEKLHDLGLLADGLPMRMPAADLAWAGRPVAPLRGYRFSCDQNGACCATYSSVIFSSLEAARARALLPGVLGGGDHPERLFSPERGASAGSSFAVAQIDGRCAFLAEGGRCALHNEAGEASKPRGCRVYPATFVDDGEALRVSVGVECPCVVRSHARDEGDPLVPESARFGRDLPPGTRVSSLGAEVAITRSLAAPRAAFVAWSKALSARLDGFEGDAPSALWSVASALDDHGLDEGALDRAIAEAKPLDVAELSPWITALADRSRRRLRAAEAWRSERDRSRRASLWIGEAATSLLATVSLGALLREPALDPSAERFYVRAIVFGHQIADELPVADGLRDRAVRLVIARALPRFLPDDDPSRAIPITLVEAMMRGHGLRAYAMNVSAERAAKVSA